MKTALSPKPLDHQRARRHQVCLAIACSEYEVLIREATRALIKLLNDLDAWYEEQFAEMDKERELDGRVNSTRHGTGSAPL